MGSTQSTWGVPALGSLTNMKLALLVGTLLSLAAAAPDAEPTPDADADPWYTYGLRHYGYGHYRPYGYYGHAYDSGERRKGTLSPLLMLMRMLMLMLTPGTHIMDMATMDTVLMDAMDTGSGERRRGMLSPLLMLMLMLMLTPGTVIMAMDSELMATMDLGIMVTTVPTTGD